MSLLDRITSLFSSSKADPHERHPDAPPLSAAENSRGPTDAEYSAAAAAQPQRGHAAPSAEGEGPGPTLPAAERLDNSVDDLEQPGVDLPPEGTPPEERS